MGFQVQKDRRGDGARQGGMGEDSKEGIHWLGQPPLEEEAHGGGRSGKGFRWFVIFHLFHNAYVITAHT